jgi:uncharacterized protein YjgD (DUF1641 family)
MTQNATAQNPQQVPATLDEASVASLVEMLNFLASARDALSDDIIIRLAGAASEGLALMDRLTRNEGLIYLLQELDRPENQKFLVSMANAFTEASRELASTPQAKGGMVCAMRLVKEPGVLEGLRLLSMIGARLSKSMREMHRHGG